MIIIAGKSHPQLAKAIADGLGVTCLYPLVKVFSNHEIQTRIDHDLEGQHVVIVQSLSQPANDHLMELMLLMDSAKRCGAREITLLIGYLGYARQDHRSHDGDCLGAYVMAKMISSCRPDRLIVVDVHRPQLEGFFDIPMINIDPTPIVFPLFKKLSLPIVVAVDHGAFEKGRKLCKALGCALVMVDKRRNVDGHCISHQLMGDVAGRDCILVDDILDTGATFCQASALVFNAKARSIRGWVTHCIISKDGWEQLNQWPITELFTSDSTVHEPIKTHEPMKGVIKTISIVALLVERLQRFRV